ncbi:hypothetical protein LTR86_000395 [Recurvomyces mirabilis]|nr:hypothetical protein LTR86_000395 [Recurvomyces mirabilis]
MDLLTATPVQLALAIIFIALLGFLFTQPNGLVKWVQKKNYQYEVTSSLYMLTPTEKFVFNSILFLTFSMLSTACILYLPDHIMTVSKRTYYYFAGDVAVGELSKQAVETATKASEGILSAAKTVYDATANTAATAGEAVGQAAESLGRD